MTYISVELLLIAVLYIGTACAWIVIAHKFRELVKKLKQSVRLVEKMRDDVTRARFMASHAKDDVSMFNVTIADLQTQIDLLIKNPNEPKVN